MTLRLLLRVLLFTVVALLGGQGTVSASADCCPTPAVEVASEADDCCDHENATGEEPHEQCPCPLPCNSGCAGYGSFRALTTSFAAVVGLPAATRSDQPLNYESRPPGPEPGDILHVPKSIRA